MKSKGLQKRQRTYGELTMDARAPYPKVEFVALREDHFPLLLEWHNLPHVQRFFSLREWTLQEIEEKYRPRLADGCLIRSELVFLEGRPVGFFQSYPWALFPYKEAQLSPGCEERALGIDFFLGDPQLLGKGLGSLLIQQGIERFPVEQWPIFIADPCFENEASIRALLRCGFVPHQRIHALDALKRPVHLQLMVKDRRLLIRIHNEEAGE